MRVGIDTNVLVYAEAADGDARSGVARALLRKLEPDEAVIATQALGELFNVLTRKGGWDRSRARDAVFDWQVFVDVATADEQTFFEAFNLAVDHRLQIWDALILATLAGAGCDLVLSEDLRDGFVWGGLTVVNPFQTPSNPRLAELLARP